MVEALVALVVLSVGMLGIAGLYVSSLRAERTAQLRTQAVTLVNDMIDRIRANAQARVGYDLYKNARNQRLCGRRDSASPARPKTWPRKTSRSGLTPPRTRYRAARVPSCTPRPPAPGLPDTYAVSVTWTEPGEGADGAPSP